MVREHATEPLTSLDADIASTVPSNCDLLVYRLGNIRQVVNLALPPPHLGPQGVRLGPAYRNPDRHLVELGDSVSRRVLLYSGRRAVGS